MEIFIRIKKLLRILGLLKLKHRNAKIEKAINIFQKIIWFTGSIFCVLSPLWFFFFEAKTFNEKSFSFVDSIFASFSMLSYYMWSREQILELFTQFESKILERNVKNENYIFSNSNINKLRIFLFRFR